LLCSLFYYFVYQPHINSSDYTIQDESKFWTFTWNYCALTAKTECWFDTAAWFSVYGGDCQVLGDLGTQSLTAIDSSNPSKGVSLQYTTQDWCGDLYVGVIIDHLCDSSVDTIENVDVIPFEGATCTSRITVKSKYGCPREPGTTLGPVVPNSGGIGGGWIFIIM